MNRRSIQWTLWISLVMGRNFTYGQDFFAPGAESKVSGTASALQCVASSCLASNPGNLRSQDQKGTHIYSELAWANFLQSYEHPNFDPVVISVMTPLASLGFSTPIAANSPVSFGMFFIPTGYGRLHIAGLPRRIAGSFESLDVRNQSTAYDLTTGISYAPAQVFQIGLGLIRRSESRKIFATRVGEGTPLIRYDGHNDFYIPTVGMTVVPTNWLDLGLAYRNDVRKTYHGRQKAALDKEVHEPRNVNYDPACALSSVRVHFPAQWSATFNFNRYFYESGRSSYREGLTSNIGRADVHDIDERSLSVQWQSPRQVSWSGGIGHSPSPWGAGHYSEVPEEQMTGTDFGLANGVSRLHYGLGMQWRGNSDRQQVSLSLFRSEGSREVGPHGDKPGFYRSETTGVSIGHQFRF